MIMKTYDFNLGNEKVSVSPQFLDYPNGRKAIRLLEAEDNTPLLTATIEVPTHPLQFEKEAILDEYSANNGVLKFLQENRIVSEVKRWVNTGTKRVPVVEVLVNEIPIHSVIGVYANEHIPYRYNGVPREELNEVVSFNIQNRPTRALFVDGRCIHKGALTNERVRQVEQELKDNPHKPRRITRPYS